MLRSGKARRTGFATADPPEQLVTKRSSCLPGATGLAVRSTMPPFAKPSRPWRALIGPCRTDLTDTPAENHPWGNAIVRRSIALDLRDLGEPLSCVGSRLLEQILTRTVLFLVPSRRLKRLNHNPQWRVGNFGENYDAQSQNSRALQIRERDHGN
jgi:hypothetical protein